MHVSAGTYRGQKRALHPLELEVHSAVSHLMWLVDTEQEQCMCLVTEQFLVPLNFTSISMF